MSGLGLWEVPCQRVVPGHHPALEQVANAPRYPQRLVDALHFAGDHTLQLVLDDGTAVVARNHEIVNIQQAWRLRIGVVTWNATSRLLAIAVRSPLEGCFFFHLTDGPYTPCDQLEGTAAADVSYAFEELVDGPLAELRDDETASGEPGH